MALDWTDRLLARPRALAVSAEGARDEPVIAAIRARFGARAQIVALGPSALPVEGLSRATVLGRALQWPGVHRLRVVSTHAGERELRFPLAGVSDAAPLTLRARPGSVVVFDVDRDPVAMDAAPSWQGECVDVAVTWGPRPLPPAARRRARDVIVRHVGVGNAAWLAGLLAASLALDTVAPLLVGASYVHYLVYLATFRARGRVAYAEFLRDAVVFKSASMACLAYVYLRWPALSWPSIALVALGVAVSSWAAAELGLVRTYFGEELGLVASRRVRSGPYAFLPHPMILGALVALVGHFLQPAARAAWPWLVPGHVLLYLLHLGQEVVGRGAAPRAGAWERADGDQDASKQISTRLTTTELDGGPARSRSSTPSSPGENAAVASPRYHS
jgi:hypothetical protein